jgi:hypothetical protein
MLDLDGLPGAELVRAGLRDAWAGVWSPRALLVASAATRLDALGLSLPPGQLPADPELRLYAALGNDPDVDDPYGRYNALRAELASFLDAADVRLRRGAA